MTVAVPLFAQGVFAGTQDKCLGDRITLRAVQAASPCCLAYKDGDGATYALTDLLAASGQDTSQQANLDVVAAGPANRWDIIPAWGLTHGGEGELEQVRQLREGEAIFKPTLASLPCAQLLLEAELEARTAEKGVWRDLKPFPTAYPTPILEKAGSYVIATGHILSLGKTARTIYLNFGPFWKLDLTATISAKREGTFSEYLKGRGLDWQDLEGRVVEIRGFVIEDDGPLIELVHPAQLGIP
ncbi:hypothetical protein [Roseibium sediminis]|uniref:hypothetical protein n=1 Tax=Roseibium sediminis TaxID=1775174 RepID=UPI00123D397C|nr:hypothetical protein [Roseibium sediminis]